LNEGRRWDFAGAGLLAAILGAAGYSAEEHAVVSESLAGDGH
jgi:hypothetical protein